MTQLAWVLGASGLLGSALVRALRQDDVVLHQTAAPFAWRDSDAVSAQIAVEVEAFAQRAHGARQWTVYWAAGVGSMGSASADLATEEHTLAVLLDGLCAHPALRACPGALVFASSAGALYGGARAACYSERSEVTPTTAYAEHKLRQEALVCALAEGAPTISALIVRYSTLYGTGQAREKAQGLITQIARRIVANEPSHIYVPLDTIRDYLHADDAARMTLATLRDIRSHGCKTTIKIIAAERATSIAQLIGVFRRVAGRTPRLVTSANSLSSKYMRCVQFISDEPAGKPHAPGRTLVEGIHQVLEAERANRTRSP
jgi:UDP-glucose 4-epimerase